MKILNTGLRLRIVWLLFGVMFFFGIEQLFLNTVIKDPSARAYATAAYITAMVLFDVPTGILADRVSRKLCLVLASLAQITCLVLMATTSTLWVYMLGSAMFGLHVCLSNGAAQAILYDWLAQTGETKRYGKEQGRNYALFLTGAGVANFASGFVAHALGLRGAYFLSIIPAALALVLIAGLVEPPVAKKQASSWYKHLGEVVHEATKHRKIIAYSLQLMATGVALYTVGEFGQVYMLAFGTSAVVLGLFWSITAAFAATGRALAYRFQRYPRILILTFCAVAGIFALTEQKFGIGLFWLFYGLNECISNVAETEVQHETSSHIRATMLSAISFVGNLIAIPILLLYNRYYLHHGIFAANQLILFILVGVMLVTLVVKPTVSKTSVALPPLPPAI